MDCATSQTFSLFDHLVRARQNGRRNRHTNLFRGFEIDNQLEFLGVQREIRRSE
jgi:hypothetical protein